MIEVELRREVPQFINAAPRTQPLQAADVGMPAREPVLTVFLKEIVQAFTAEFGELETKTVRHFLLPFAEEARRADH